MGDRVVNNFSVRVATKNGTGSQSSNNIIFRALFSMGVGVNGKNLFPSNIQGLPTWFLIRASREGYCAPLETHNVHILMNAPTAVEDMSQVHSGDAVIYNSDLKTDPKTWEKEGVHFYPVPFDQLAKKEIKEVKLRGLLKNMLYVGVFAQLFDLDQETLKKSVEKVFESKPKVWQLNIDSIWVGIKYAQENLKKTDKYYFEKDRHYQKDHIIIEGNQAIAVGAMFAGTKFVSWYPITPSSSAMESLIGFLEKYRIDDKGKKQFAAVQAEDELASIGMALGAGWAGIRSITATSGPGISLMAENYGFGYYAEIPTVIVDVQRVGPSTGLPTRTQQGDLTEVAFLSQGDTKQIILFPADPQECFELTYESFNVAERIQQPIFIMSDLDVGMNLWPQPKFNFPEKPYDRGKVLQGEDFKKVKNWGRYDDVDGDGIGYRTLPGEEAEGAAYFTRGSGHNAQALITV